MLARFAGESESGNPEAIGMPLGDILVAQGYVTEAQRDTALLEQADTGARLGEILVRTQILTPRDIAMALAAQLGLRTIDLAAAEPDIEVANCSGRGRGELRSVPLGVQGDRVVVACADPRVEQLEQRLIEVLEAPIRIVIAAEDELQWALDHCYRTSVEIDDALRDFEQRAEERRKQLADAGDAVVIEVDENAPVVKVLNLILEQAVRNRV